MSGANKGRKKAWRTMVGLARGCFSAPSFTIFSSLLTGWVLVPGRRTITGMICAGDPAGCEQLPAIHLTSILGAWSNAEIARSPSLDQ